jgi:hypothetical protein
MAADDGGTIRVAMVFPGHDAIVDVEETQVDTFIAQGWRKVRTRRADTGSVPVQSSNK